MPDPETAPAWAKKNGVEGDSMQDICKSEKLKAEILKSITALGKESKLRGFEQVRDGLKLEVQVRDGLKWEVQVRD